MRFRREVDDPSSTRRETSVWGVLRSVALRHLVSLRNFRISVVCSANFVSRFNTTLSYSFVIARYLKRNVGKYRERLGISSKERRKEEKATFLPFEK